MAPAPPDRRRGAQAARLPPAACRLPPSFAEVQPGAGRAAAVALLAFAWFELIAPGRTDPLVIGLCLIGYALIQLAVAAWQGERRFARGDFFEVYSELAGRLSPLRWRPPLAVLADELPVVLFMIACTWADLFLLFVR